MRWVSDATRAQRTPQRVSLSTDEESGLFLSGLERRFTSLCFGVEALEAVSLRINIRSAILIWIVMPVWAFFTWKCELEWETVPVDFPESRVSGYSQSCPSGYAWLSLTRHFVPLPISSLEGGAGDTLHVFFMAKTLVHAFITSAWLVWGAHGGHSSISSTARKKENQRDRTFFLFSLFLLGVSRGVD